MVYADNMNKSNRFSDAVLLIRFAAILWMAYLGGDDTYRSADRGGTGPLQPFLLLCAPGSSSAGLFGLILLELVAAENAPPFIPLIVRHHHSIAYFFY